MKDHGNWSVTMYEIDDEISDTISPKMQFAKN